MTAASRRRAPGSRQLPEGLREAEPLLVALFAFTAPVALLAVAATGGGAVFLVLALVVMGILCGGVAMLVKRLMGDHADGADAAPPATSLKHRDGARLDAHRPGSRTV